MRVVGATASAGTGIVTDYRWLVLYFCLRLFCDLHNDGATGTEEEIGPYEIERIDFGAVVEQFLFDNRLFDGGNAARRRGGGPGQLSVTRQAWRIAGSQAGSGGSATHPGLALGQER